MNIGIEHITPVFRDALENDSLVFTETSRAKDYEEWDSITHIYLVNAVEKKFKVKFTTYQILSWTCVGDILRDLNQQTL